MAFWKHIDEFGLELDVRSSLYIGITIVSVYWVITTAAQWYRLSHVPGPFLASITSLLSYRWMRSKQFHNVVCDVQDRYGEIVRITPTGVMITDPATFWRINSARSAYGRSAWYESIRFDAWSETVLTEMDPVAHDRRKAKLLSGFSGKGLMDLEGNVDTQIGVLVDVLSSRIAAAAGGSGHAVVDMGTMLVNFQVDMITFIGLGESWGNMAQGEDHFGYLADGERNVASIHAISMVPWARKIMFSHYFLRFFGPDTNSGWIGSLRTAIKRQISEGPGEAKSNHENMLSAWLKSGLKPEQAEGDLSVLLPAGTDTAIYTIRATLMYLIVSPGIYSKLKQEIADASQRGVISSPIKNEEAKKLPYLQAVLSEGMRMAPAVNATFPKSVPPGGDVVCGKALPEGTEVHINLLSLMRDREIFGDDAELFRPERFLDCDEATASRRRKVVEIIFGHGRWLCLGKPLALMEMNKIIVELLRVFDFQIIDPDKPWNRLSTITWWIKDFNTRVTHNPIG